LQEATARLYALAAQQIGRDLRTKSSPWDLVQDTLLQAYRRLGQFHGQSRLELESWLISILVNVTRNFRRSFRGAKKRQIHREVPLATANTDRQIVKSSDETACAERTGMVRHALRRLPRRYQRVLVMRFWKKQSFEAIGKEENRSKDAARMLCTRAMKALALELHELN
jgi:RNA polymerase sigma factor (sigma-70 family)